MDFQNLGARICYVRKLYGLKGVDLADKAGIDQSYLSKIEKGKHLPNLQTLCSIAEVLNCSVDYLLMNGAIVFPFTKYHDCLISLCDVCGIKTLGFTCPATKSDCTYYSDSKVETCSYFVLNRKFLTVDVTDGFEEDK